jgi:release factor glutamine methyltransferase
MSNHGNKQRALSIYEKQQLLKYGLSEAEFLKMGEMPVEYFTGRVDFAGLTLEVNQDVLIPRIESEELVDQALDFAKSCPKQQLRILEIATGSGAIALALINKIQQLNYLTKSWEFVLTEISAPALAVAKKNYHTC